MESHLGEVWHLLAWATFPREKRLFIATEAMLLAISLKVPRRRVTRWG